MFKNIILLLCVSLIAVACSKTVKGPLSGKKYDVKVGGWSDMDKYREARESVEKGDASREDSEECNAADCPDDDKGGIE